MGLHNLGMSNDDLPNMEMILERPHGILLVTGPTGSGKTTTLYASLAHINDIERKIITIEDPIEYQLHGINQIQVSRKAGLSFASGLRSILRHDPDVVLVGEIRDLETAEIAIKAAQTGHLVLSTLHTNDAPQSVTRLMNMGVPSYNITSAVNLIVAQRLVRTLHKCKKPLDMPPEALIQAGFGKDELEELRLYQPTGCGECNEGYRGRTGIFEVMPITDAIARIILEEGNAIRIQEQARTEGIFDLRQSALRKVANGVTDLIEINRVTKD
jgi:type IV pilus assembly protein PilB